MTPLASILRPTLTKKDGWWAFVRRERRPNGKRGLGRCHRSIGIFHGRRRCPRDYLGRHRANAIKSRMVGRRLVLTINKKIYRLHEKTRVSSGVCIKQATLVKVSACKIVHDRRLELEQQKVRY